MDIGQPAVDLSSPITIQQSAGDFTPPHQPNIDPSEQRDIDLPDQPDIDPLEQWAIDPPEHPDIDQTEQWHLDPPAQPDVDPPKKQDLDPSDVDPPKQWGHEPPELHVSNQIPKKSETHNVKRTPGLIGFHAGGIDTSQCSVCDAGKDPLYASSKLKSMPHEAKLSTVKVKKLCNNCLGSCLF